MQYYISAKRENPHFASGSDSLSAAATTVFTIRKVPLAGMLKFIGNNLEKHISVTLRAETKHNFPVCLDSSELTKDRLLNG